MSQRIPKELVRIIYDFIPGNNVDRCAEIINHYMYTRKIERSADAHRKPHRYGMSSENADWRISVWSSYPCDIVRFDNIIEQYVPGTNPSVAIFFYDAPLKGPSDYRIPIMTVISHDIEDENMRIEQVKRYRHNDRFYGCDPQFIIETIARQMSAGITEVSEKYKSGQYGQALVEGSTVKDFSEWDIFWNPHVKELPDLRISLPWSEFYAVFALLRFSTRS
jgi:hypothetical protein